MTASLAQPPSMLVPEAVRPELLRAWPTLRAAATLLRISPSVLSRRDDLAGERRGNQLRIRPSVVLSLGNHYRRRSLHELASDLLDYAYENAPDLAELVDEEIESFFGPTPVGLDPTRFLAAAREALPGDVFEEVLRVYESSRTEFSPGRASR